MNHTAPITVGIIGALGKMGQEAVQAVCHEPDLSLVAVVDSKFAPDHPRHTWAVETLKPLLTAEVSMAQLVLAGRVSDETIKAVSPQVWVDLTNPTAVFANAQAVIGMGGRPVIGATGLSEAQHQQLHELLLKTSLAGCVIPNFAIGAVLMMRFAQEAAQYFDHAEIIERHHNQKLDAPSGTSLQTAVMMQAGRQQATCESGASGAFGPTNVQDSETLTGARGGVAEGNIHIHSVRLPGSVAHQEVIFGSPGQTFTLRHDSIDRKCFMPGVILCIRAMMTREPGLVVGMETLLR